jgi:hypothetical protein
MSVAKQSFKNEHNIGNNFGLKSLPKVASTTTITPYYMKSSRGSHALSLTPSYREVSTESHSKTESTTILHWAGKVKEFFANTWRGIVQLYHNTLAVRKIKEKERFVIGLIMYSRLLGMDNLLPDANTDL